MDPSVMRVVMAERDSVLRAAEFLEWMSFPVAVLERKSADALTWFATPFPFVSDDRIPADEAHLVDSNGKCVGKIVGLDASPSAR